MKRKILLSMTLLSAILTMGSIAPTARAAETGTVSNISRKCYQVYVGQGINFLKQMCKKFGVSVGNGGNSCPNGSIQATPDAGAVSYAEQVVALVNAERAKAGLPALKIKSDITAAANVRAKEIKQSFSHTRPNGSNFSSALKEQGVSFRSSGENIAWGQKSPEHVMNAWMNSAGHRANILNKNFNHIGVGYYQDEKGVKYWVQLFTN